MLRELPPPALVSRPAPTSRLNATLTARVDLSDAVARFRIRPDAGVPPFRAGQYFSVGLPVGERVLQRPYSTASAPGRSDDLEFLIRKLPNGELTPRLWAQAPGARLMLGRPKGLFSPEPGDDRTHLLISTGTGLAPFISIVGELARLPSPPRTIMLHGATRQDELAYRSWLEAMASRAGHRLTYLPAVSRPAEAVNASWRGAIGRLDGVLRAAWDTLELVPTHTVAFLCGNPALLDAMTDLLRGAGLPDPSIRREAYWSAIRTVGD